MAIRDNLGGGSSGAVLDTLEEIAANTESGKAAGALAVKKLNESLTASDNLKFQFATDGEGRYGYLGADDSFIPFKSGSLDNISTILIYSRKTGSNGCAYAYSNQKLMGGNYLSAVVTDDLQLGAMGSGASTTNIKALKVGLRIEYYIWKDYVFPERNLSTTSTNYTKFETVSTEVNETIYSNSDSIDSGIFIVYK